MDKKVKDILDFLMEQGKEITREVLEEKLEEAYKQGRIDSSDEWIERTLNDIYYNIVLELDKRKINWHKKISIMSRQWMLK